MLATSRRLAKPLVAGARSFAAKGKGGAAAAAEVVDLTKVVPTNILKDGAHPELKDKSEYPEWLFTLLDPKPTLGELERAGFDSLEMEEQHRYLVLLNRRTVKGNNAEKAKK
ncbi:Mitochondrial ribosomal protein L54 [Phytophthora pseudosyringae]|uniref:Large ribosomal subunit protein mL54 n=1 Tax=Phytophthora pseudosyringae TaxID=221518 RepID=A0A8T1V983_9STRA|nr:Mitochondrial ribosomal protein L54 [Phytophthora pseudosyringae]